MTKAKIDLYVHKSTGAVMQATKKQSKQLGDGWDKIKFVTNEKGERVMRFNVDGATVDVQEADMPAVPKEIIDVDSKPE